MEDWQLVLLSSGISFSIALIIMGIKDVYLDKQRRKEERRKRLVQNRLEKLYTPLYTIIKANEITFGRKEMSFWNDNEGNSNLGDIRKIIQHNLHLAEPELQSLLAEYFNKPTKTDIDKSNKLSDLIFKGYEDLRNEYYDI